MVNEAFITEIQSGNREHLEELWDSVRPFVERQARRRVRACQNGGAYCGTEVEDLIQDGFLAFLRAAETYQGGGRMTFLGWLDLHLKNAFNEALGVRRVRDYREPTVGGEPFTASWRRRQRYNRGPVGGKIQRR